MRVTVIHNPASGEARHTREELLHVIRRAGHRALYRSSKADGWRAALDEPTDLVVAAGGDGTVDKVALAMAGREVPVAILPLGTANNVARALRLSLDLEQLIARWSRAETRRLDVGLIRGVPGPGRFLEAVGLGVFPGLMAEHLKEASNEGNGEAKLARDLERLRERLVAEPAHHWRVRLDGRDLSGEHLLVEAMNIGALGPGLCLAPRANPGDGLLDVVTVAEHERERLVEHLTRRIRGEQEPAPVEVVRGRQLVLYGPRADVHVDGKLVPAREVGEHGLNVHVGVWPRAVDVLV